MSVDHILEAFDQPWVLLVAALLVGLMIAGIWSLLHVRGRGTKDRRRMFTTDERLTGFARSGGQCEYDRWMVFRCTRTAEHGDHFYPWSKGGATSMRNFVSACPRCNTTKGARMPSTLQAARIRARRARYFPAGTPVDVGEWAGRGAR